MPLRNSQYDTLMRRYEEIREAHRHELLDREAEIAEKIPGIAALDARAAAASIAAARRRISSPDADLGYGYNPPGVYPHRGTRGEGHPIGPRWRGKPLPSLPGCCTG